MKTLNDWLASSSSSTDDSRESRGSESGAEGARPLSQPMQSNPSPSPYSVSVGGFPTSASAAGSVVSSVAATAPAARVVTTNYSPTSSRSNRLDETRAKMETLLGQESVQRIQSPQPASLSGSVASQSVPLRQFPVNAPFGLTPTTNNAATAPFAVAMPAGSVGGVGSQGRPFSDSPSLRSQQLPQQQGQPSNEALLHYEPVEVMVVDRGTQTVTTVGVQTDPEPPFPPTLPGVHYPPGYTMPSYYPCGVAGVDYTAQGSVGRFGVDGRPYRQQFHELEQRQSRDAGELRKQLETIQNSIDMLISRYNLPPPPSFS